MSMEKIIEHFEADILGTNKPEYNKHLKKYFCPVCKNYLNKSNAKSNICCNCGSIINWGGIRS